MAATDQKDEATFSLEIRCEIGLDKKKADALARRFGRLADLDEADNDDLLALGMGIEDLLLIRQFFGA